MDPTEEINSLKDEIKVRDDQIEVLRKNVEEAKNGSNTSNQELLDKVEKLEEHNKSLLEQNQDSGVRLNTLQSQYDLDKAKYETDIAEKNTKINELEQAQADALAKQQETESRLEEALSTDDKGDLLKKITDELTEAHIDLETHRNLLKEHKTQKIASEEEISLLNLGNEELQKELKKLTAKLETSSSDNTNMLETYKKQEKILEDKLNAVTSSWEIEVDKNSKLESRVANFEKEIAAHKKNFEDKINVLSKEIDELRSAGNAAQLGLQYKENKIESMRKQIEGFKQSLTDKEMEIESWDAEKKRLMKDAHTWKVKMNEEKQKHEILNKKFDQFRREIRSNEKTIRSLKDKVTGLEASHDHDEKRMADVIADNASNEKEYTDMKKKFQSMSTDIAKKDEYIVKFAAQATKYKDNLEDYKKQIALTKDKKIREYETQVGQKDIEIQVQNQMISSANKMVQVKNIENSRLQKKLTASVKYLKVMNSNDKLKQEQERLDMSYISKIGHVDNAGITHTSMPIKTRQQSAKSKASLSGKSILRPKLLGAMKNHTKLLSVDNPRLEKNIYFRKDKNIEESSMNMIDVPILEKNDDLENSAEFENSHNNKTAEDIIRQIENDVETSQAEKKPIGDIQKIIQSD